MSLFNSGARYEPCIIELASGEYTIMGCPIPIELTVEKVDHLGQKYRDTLLYDTEAEAEKAVEKAFGAII